MKINLNRISIQVLIWGVAWAFMAFLLNSGTGDTDSFFRRAFLQFLGIALIVSVNLKILVPELYLKKRIILFVLFGILLFVAVVWLLTYEYFPWSDWIIHQERPFNALQENDKLLRGKTTVFGIKWMRHIVPFFMAFLGSTLVEVSRFANQKEKALIEIEKEKLHTELKFLKSQINPHFLFNTLNNIYTLTVIKSDNASKSLLNLSGLLRYMLYDTNEEFVSLKKEIEYLKNYISLALLKDSKGMNVTIDIDESQPDLRIAPLLLVPFVENAFKHSKIEDLQNGTISIRLKTYESRIEFLVINSLPAERYHKDDVGGIGLVNTTKRLKLIYPKKHTLDITKDNQLYSVFLIIDLI